MMSVVYLVMGVSNNDGMSWPAKAFQDKAKAEAFCEQAQAQANLLYRAWQDWNRRRNTAWRRSWLFIEREPRGTGLWPA